MTRGSFTGIALAALLAIAPGACTDAVGPEEEPIEQLVFLSTRVGPREDIYRMNADGTAVEKLTGQPENYYGLSLSPDGNQLAFARLCDIWVVNTSGAGQSRLTNRSGGFEERCNYRPRWSRDGSRIAFTTNREGRQIGPHGGLPDVYVMNADGSDPHNVSYALGDQLGNNVVEVTSWSADGRVVFETFYSVDGAYRRRSYSVNPDGTGMRPLLIRAGDDSPFWSPDGSKVAFISARTGRRQLYVMNADGTDERPLTAGSHDDHLPTGLAGSGFSQREPEYNPWAPDGTRIAFERWGGTLVDNSIVYVINVDGSGLRRLSSEASEFNGWSSSGKRIAFTQWAWQAPDPPGIPEVFVINADGTGLTNLTNHSAGDFHAIWLRRR